MKKLLCTLLLCVLLFSSAGADVYLIRDGYAQTARATAELSLRQDPTTHSSALGTYPITGQYIILDGKSWDSDNNIWWVRCSFNYNGGMVRGWTGVQRFDGNSFALSQLPEYELAEGFSSNSNDNGGTTAYGTQYALATSRLSLRSEPTTKSSYVGMYYVSGEYIELSARSWDSDNNIWWVKCSFSCDGARVTGWTGTKRFDGNTYDLFALPEYFY